MISRAETELQSHYAEASLSRQYDGRLWFDDTRAVTPLAPDHRQQEAPDTWPFAV